MAPTLGSSGNDGTDFRVAGFARIREIQRPDLNSGDISYTHFKIATNGGNK